MNQLTIFKPKGDRLIELIISTEQPDATSTLKEITKVIDSDYFFLKIKQGEVTLDEKQITEWINFAASANASFSYSNYRLINESETKLCPTINYTLGSIRDDFNFGALLLIKTASLITFLQQNKSDFQFAGLYSFRLFADRNNQLLKFNEFTHIWKEQDLRFSGQKQFDYVNPANRERQIEMELAATNHLKEIGALVTPPFKEIDFSESSFQVEASVIIPVLNRKTTISDAIESVLKQKTNFPFNLIVIDNHSTDGTTELLQQIEDPRLVHMIPERTDLGIGGCWNEGINHTNCGRFAIQLDSDDLYSDENTIQKVVDKFREENCAMVIGSYQMVNFKLEEIPPGVIDHREWTDDNGPNNALRINGLGAPRAFYTPIIRLIGFPNVSYGEDYAVALAISRTYKTGRIYEPIYLCRRWDENTDSNLSIEKMNTHNTYKDSLRTKEIMTRKMSVVIGQ